MEEKKRTQEEAGIDVREVMVMEDYRETEEDQKTEDRQETEDHRKTKEDQETEDHRKMKGERKSEDYRGTEEDQKGTDYQETKNDREVEDDPEKRDSGKREKAADGPDRWEAVVEAVLFTMGQSVELRQLAAAIGQDEKTARQVTTSLKERYDRERRGIQIIELDNCYQMCTRVEYYENLIRVAAAPKKHVLTDVVLETLSIIAYKQPVTKLEIEKIRGVKSDHAVNRLVEYNLVQEVGRLDAPGRPALFATTEEFLRRFGIGSMEQLPDMNPVRAEEIRNEVEEELKIRMEELQEDRDGV